jgi:hypothetical protein
MKAFRVAINTTSGTTPLLGDHADEIADYLQRTLVAAGGERSWVWRQDGTVLLHQDAVANLRQLTPDDDGYVESGASEPVMWIGGSGYPLEEEGAAR